MSEGEGNGNGLEARFDTWVARAVQAGEVWILVDDEDFNTVLEDPEGERDLHMFFTSEADAASKAEGTSPLALTLPDFADLLDEVEQRGEALALWDGESWIVADPDAMAENLPRAGE